MSIRFCSILNYKMLHLRFFPLCSFHVTNVTKNNYSMCVCDTEIRNESTKKYENKHIKRHTSNDGWDYDINQQVCFFLLFRCCCYCCCFFLHLIEFLFLWGNYLCVTIVWISAQLIQHDFSNLCAQRTSGWMASVRTTKRNTTQHTHSLKKKWINLSTWKKKWNKIKFHIKIAQRFEFVMNYTSNASCKLTCDRQLFSCFFFFDFFFFSLYCIDIVVDKQFTCQGWQDLENMASPFKMRRKKIGKNSKNSFLIARKIAIQFIE